MLGLLRGLSRFIILFIWPYSCCLCRICWAKADWGSLFLMYLMCSWKRIFRLRLVWPTYDTLHELQVN